MARTPGVGQVFEHALLFREKARGRRSVNGLRRSADILWATRDAILGLTHEGRVVEANPAALALWNSRKVIGGSLAQMSASGSRETTARALAAAAAGETPAPFEAEFDRPGGLFVASVILAPSARPTPAERP